MGQFRWLLVVVVAAVCSRRRGQGPGPLTPPPSTPPLLLQVRMLEARGCAFGAGPDGWAWQHELRSVAPGLKGGRVQWHGEVQQRGGCAVPGDLGLAARAEVGNVIRDVLVRACLCVGGGVGGGQQWGEGELGGAATGGMQRRHRPHSPLHPPPLPELVGLWRRPARRAATGPHACGPAGRAPRRPRRRAGRSRWSIDSG